MCRKQIIHQIFDIICDCHYSRCERRENGMVGRKEQKEREEEEDEEDEEGKKPN